MATQAELEQVRRALNRLSTAAASDMQAVWDSLSTGDRVRASRALREGWLWVLERYGNMAATLAADFFEVEARNLNLTPRVQLAKPEEGRAMGKLGWALSTDDQHGNLWVALDELVKQPYRQTVQASAHASGGAWARVPKGSHTCAWCLMLASRGAVYKAEDRAGGPGHRWHGKCDCQPVLVRDERDYPEGYDPDGLYDMYDKAKTDAGYGPGGKSLSKTNGPRQGSHEDESAVLSAFRQRFGTN